MSLETEFWSIGVFSEGLSGLVGPLEPERRGRRRRERASETKSNRQRQPNVSYNEEKREGCQTDVKSHTSGRQ
jgi:hypothetical protein